MKGEFRLGVRNLLVNRRRTLLTILSIAIGCAAVVFIFGYGIRFERYLRTAQVYLLHTGHISIYKTKGLRKHLVDPSRYGFPAAEQAAATAILSSESGIERVTPYLLGAGLVSNGCKTFPYRIIGARPEDEKWIYTHPDVVSATPELIRMQGGGFWDHPDLTGSLMMSRGLAARLHKNRVASGGEKGDDGGVEVLDCKAPDVNAQFEKDANVQLLSSTFSGDFAAQDGTLSGIYTTGFSESEDNTILTALDGLQKFHETDSITYLAVFLKDRSQARPLASQLKQKLAAAGIQTDVYIWDDPIIAPNYAAVIPMLKQVFVLIMLIMSTIVGLSVVNAMTMSVMERSRELGTLRAMGFKTSVLTRLLLIEVAILGAIGVTAGIGLGLLMAGGVNALNIRFTPPSIAGTIQFMITPSVALCVGVALIVFFVAVGVTWAATRRRLNRKITLLLYDTTT